MNPIAPDAPSPRELRALLRRQRLSVDRTPLGRVLFAVVVAAWMWVGDSLALAVIFTALALLSIAWAFVPPGVRVDAQSQPELWQTVERAAARLGVAPRAVWLVHRPQVQVRARPRRIDLLVGLPVLARLESHELSALIAHELAHLRFPRPELVVPLVARWREVAVARSDEDASDSERSAEVDLRGLALAVEKVADDAAVAAGGSARTAARAIVARDTTSGAHEEFLGHLGSPRRRWWMPVAVGLEDIDDVWCRLVADGALDPDWDDEVAVDEAHQHPSLADEVLELGEGTEAMAAPGSPVRYRPLDRRSRRRLARRTQRLPLFVVTRWYTVATAPLRWWVDRARRDVKGLRPDVAQALGREPADHLEMAEVVLLRNERLLAILEDRLAAALRKMGVRDVPSPLLGQTPADGAASDLGAEDELTAGPYQPPRVVAALVEDVLLPRGWRLEHPAVRGVLIGPHGQRVDAFALGREVMASRDMAPLRPVLTP